MEMEAFPMESHTNSSDIESASTDFDGREEFETFLRHAERAGSSSGNPKSLRAWMDMAEAYRITQALRDCKGNRSAAARMLGIGRRTLYAKMDKLGITPTWSVQG